ncbi:hypothetical protein HK100_002952 [Physocladia obscura]|uniref:F-box domain-containing protein n=1 Tax=Physocladia obscura TaxID=109957 RepID=A0AAD5XF16_9FUNG|nr:hypothetical protein HK100_002952 [Physocladia obscura]
MFGCRFIFWVFLQIFLIAAFKMETQAVYSLSSKRSTVAKHEAFRSLPYSLPGNPNIPTASSTAVLAKFPPEIVSQVLKHIPIDPHAIKNIGMSSKQLFARLLFCDLAFARWHFHHQLDLFADTDGQHNSGTFWRFLDARKLKNNQVWRSLPFNYQCAIYAEILLVDFDLQPPTLLPNNLSSESMLSILSKSWSNYHFFNQKYAVVINRLIRETNDFKPTFVPFLHACVHGELEAAKLLYGTGAIIASDNGNIAIFYAACNGHDSMVEYLLNIGVNPSEIPDNKFTGNIQYSVLEGAFYSRNERLIMLILKDERIDPSENHNKAIITAAKINSTNIVEFLLKDARVDPTDGYNAALNSAIWANSIDTAAFLLCDPRSEIGIFGAVSRAMYGSELDWKMVAIHGTVIAIHGTVIAICIIVVVILTATGVIQSHISDSSNN